MFASLTRRVNIDWVSPVRSARVENRDVPVAWDIRIRSEASTWRPAHWTTRHGWRPRHRTGKGRSPSRGVSKG